MDTRQLQVFYTLMEFRSVTRSAKILGVSQPAISMMIKRLEGELGIVLFNRDNRRLNPTPEAMLLMEQVGQTLQSFGKLRSVVDDIKLAGTGTLTIAANPTCSISWLPTFIAEFRAKRPGVRLRLMTRSSDVLRENAAAYAADITISEPPLDASQIHGRRYKFRCVAALQPGHPLCDHAVLTPELVSPFPFIALSRWQNTYYRVCQAFNDCREALNIVVESELFSSALSMVSAGAGVTIAEPISAHAFERDGKIVVRRFEPEIRYEIALSYPFESSLSILATEFISEFGQYIDTYVDGPRSGIK